LIISTIEAEMLYTRVLRQLIIRYGSVLSASLQTAR